MIKRILNCQRQHWEPVLILAIAVCFFSYRLDFTEEAEVYATYINAQLLRNPLTKIPYSRLVIKDHTSGDFRDLLKQEIAKLGPKLDSYTAKDFIARNARYFGGFSLTSLRKGLWGHRVLNPRIKFQIPHVLISEPEMEQIFSHGGWNEFNKLYPNSRGEIDLSNVGFNRSRNQALFYIGNQWDWLAGEGRLILLEKKNGRCEVYPIVWTENRAT